MVFCVPPLWPQRVFAYLINLWWGLNSLPVCQLQQGLSLNSQQWRHKLTASPWWWNDGGKQKQPPELQMLLLEAVCCVEVVRFCPIVCGWTHTYSYLLMCVNICLHARVSGGYGTQLGGRVNAFIPALRGRGPHRYPARGWKAALQMSPAGVQWPSQ